MFKTWIFLILWRSRIAQKQIWENLDLAWWVVRFVTLQWNICCQINLFHWTYTSLSLRIEHSRTEEFTTNNLVFIYVIFLWPLLQVHDMVKSIDRRAHVRRANAVGLHKSWFVLQIKCRRSANLVETLHHSRLFIQVLEGASLYFTFELINIKKSESI